MRKRVIKLIQKYVLEQPKFQDGDLVQTIHGDEVFSVVGTYYDFDLDAQLFIMDANRRIYGVDAIEYKQCQNPKVIENANY